MTQTTSQANYTVPVLVGGLVGAVLAVVPPCCCLFCLNAVIAGAIAGAMYTRSAGFPPIERGALIGALAGALAGAGRSVLGALWNAAMSSWTEGWVDQLARYGDAEARELIDQLGALESSSGPGWFLAGLVTSVGVGALLGAAGGMLGVVLARRQPPPPPPPRYDIPPMPPPPPTSGAGLSPNPPSPAADPGSAGPPAALPWPPPPPGTADGDPPAGGSAG